MRQRRLFYIDKRHTLQWNNKKYAVT
jgi:hypothetical protein